MRYVHSRFCWACLSLAPHLLLGDSTLWAEQLKYSPFEFLPDPLIWMQIFMLPSPHLTIAGNITHCGGFAGLGVLGRSVSLVVCSRSLGLLSRIVRGYSFLGRHWASILYEG
jgi:hypothetical protein